MSNRGLWLGWIVENWICAQSCVRPRTNHLQTIMLSFKKFVKICNWKSFFFQAQELQESYLLFPLCTSFWIRLSTCSELLRLFRWTSSIPMHFQQLYVFFLVRMKQKSRMQSNFRETSMAPSFCCTMLPITCTMGISLVMLLSTHFPGYFFRALHCILILPINGWM